VPDPRTGGPAAKRVWCSSPKIEHFPKTEVLGKPQFTENYPAKPAGFRGFFETPGLKQPFIKKNKKNDKKNGNLA
jgi:hypothetical protein